LVDVYKHAEGNRAIEESATDKWAPLTRDQALAARDFSSAGETFIDHKGEAHEVLYSILTPLGYQTFVSGRTLRHLQKHSITARHQNDLPHMLNNPDLIVPNYELPTVHLYYKIIDENLFVAAVHQKENFRFVATMHKTPTIKGLIEKFISQKDFLYTRGGFKWKRWK